MTSRATPNMFVGLLPAGCLHAHRAVLRAHSWCKCSRSSLGKCTRPAPTWKCASSYRWFSACHSAEGRCMNYTNVKEMLTLTLQCWTPCAYRQPFANISSVKPALSVQRLGSPLWVFKVALKHVWALYTHLDQRPEDGWGRPKRREEHLEWLTSPSPLEAK